MIMMMMAMMVMRRMLAKMKMKLAKMFLALLPRAPRCWGMEVGLRRG